MAGAFQTTLWSRIEEVQRGDSQEVVSFVDRYRPPLLRFVRGRGFPPQDAEDLVQEVFLRLFTREALARADRTRGRFRSFLLGIAKNVIREEYERRAAQKRGGGARPVPLSQAPEAAYEEESESEFDQIWSDHLLRQALADLRQESPRQHETLQLRFEQKLSYKEIAERLERNLQQVKNDIHRARRKLVKTIKAEISRYSSSSAEYEDELASFLTFLGEK